MEERQVTFEGRTRPLPRPFFVIATQNPAHIVGTFPLPESQLDRFLMRIELGYPAEEAERHLLTGEDRREMLQRLDPVMQLDELIQHQKNLVSVHVSPALLDYLQALLTFTRESTQYRLGLSPRAGLGLQAAARAWAYLDDRKHVEPEDMQTVLGPVVGHRLQPSMEDAEILTPAETVQHLLESVPVP
jgi:MoxR-like ATPase